MRVTARFTLVFLVILGTSAATVRGQAAFEYAESDAIIANPDRGLQKYSITNNTYYTATGYSNLNETTLRGWRTGGDRVTVIYRYFLLGDYMESPISENYLENINLDFERIRNSGLKCLVRFSYTNRQGSGAQQPVKARILEHIEQLAPVLERNQDVILAHQAGFIGTWGEWYYTNSLEFGTDGSITPNQWNNRKEVVAAMLDATPPSIPIQVRYPQVKLTMYGSNQLDETTAYQNTPNARIGFYNDAFLNVWGDMGTYRGAGQHGNPVTTSDYAYLSNETQYTPMSGETNGLNAPRTDGENAIHEMDLTNWSIINRDYHASVLNGWIASGHFPEILRRLGYRLALRSAAFELNDDRLDVTIDLVNTGFARPFLKRDVNLVFRPTDGSDDRVFPLDTDFRTWAGEVTLEENIDMATLGLGSYEVFLALPDVNLSDRSEYAVRLANDGVWVEDEGLNRLGLIHVSEGQVVSTEKAELPSGGATLHQSYPNPVRTKATIPYELDVAGSVHLAVYDVLGRLVRVIENTHKPAGVHKAHFSRDNLGSGTYFVQLTADGAMRSVRPVIVN
jgi:hypothetical protein